MGMGVEGKTTCRDLQHYSVFIRRIPVIAVIRTAFLLLHAVYQCAYMCELNSCLKHLAYVALCVGGVVGGFMTSETA
jgi:hypothetical protein